MKATRSERTVRTTVIETELSEEEVSEAIAGYVIAHSGPGIPAPGAKGVTWQVRISDRTGEAEVTIKHEQEVQ